ncbi:hypothetical protein BD414DRAFT_510633 [Trametes punicea]|nr:hypothetical protein BD414DRAFT_510633 [Trametes punicea]
MATVEEASHHYLTANVADLASRASHGNAQTVSEQAPITPLQPTIALEPTITLESTIALQPTAPLSVPTAQQHPVLPPTVEEVASTLSWPQIKDSGCTTASQKKTSLLEAHQAALFTAVHHTHPIPLMVDPSPQTDALLQDRTRSERFQFMWTTLRTSYGYRSEAMLQSHLNSLFGLFLEALPNQPAGYYHPDIANHPTVQVVNISGYANATPRVHYDIVLNVQVSNDQLAQQSADYVFFLIEVKTERALNAKLRRLSQIFSAGRLSSDDPKDFTDADRMLLQVWSELVVTSAPGGLLMGDNLLFIVERRGGTLYVDGPYYCFPTEGQRGFTPLDALHLIARMFVARGQQTHEEAMMAAQANVPVAARRMPRTLPLRPMRNWMSFFRRIFDEIQLTTCPTLRIRYPWGAIIEYHRAAGPLTGRLPASRWWKVIRFLSRFMPSTAQVDLVGEIGGGDITAAWRGYLGTTSVVLKMNRFIEEQSENRAVLDEWRRLSARLPGDIKRATALPIPAYHGLFVREEADMILMSDCGDPLEAYLDDEQGEELR